MNKEEAQKILDLLPAHTAADVELAAKRLIDEATDKRDRAPTPQLKVKFRSLIELPATA
jgi:hypothetical protein